MPLPPDGRFLDSGTTDRTRREFLVQSGGFVVLAVAVGACRSRDARDARERRDPFQVLSESEGRTLEALGDTLLPGAAAAGLAYYVDRQLAAPAPLLLLRYMDYPGPLADFYTQGLAALDRLALARHRLSFADAGAGPRADLVRAIAAAMPADWTGPPAPLFYFVLRNDALDVVYGTPEGFAALEIPYMPHIAPVERW